MNFCHTQKFIRTQKAITVKEGSGKVEFHHILNARYLKITLKTNFDF